MEKENSFDRIRKAHFNAVIQEATERASIMLNGIIAPDKSEVRNTSYISGVEVDHTGKSTYILNTDTMKDNLSEGKAEYDDVVVMKVMDFKIDKSMELTLDKDQVMTLIRHLATAASLLRK